MRILLIQMPFFSAYIPSISLATVKSALEEQATQCEIRYANVQFAERVGVELYQAVHEKVPQQLLLGDLIFSPALYPARRLVAEDVALLADALPGCRGRDDIFPEHLAMAFPRLIQAATDFVDDLIESTNWHEFDLIGIGTIFNIIPPLAVARRIKEVQFSPPIILGGSQCEGEMGEALHREFPWIDFVCRGEGEKLMPALVQELKGSRSFHRIAGLIWRGESGETKWNGLAAEGHKDLDRLPIPHFGDWVDAISNTTWASSPLLRLPIETSRGCWYGAKAHCTFCGLNGLSIGFRRKSAERALAEFGILRQYGIESITAVDNILDYKYFQDFIPALGVMDHGCMIFYEVKSNLTYEQMRQLRNAGIVCIQPGIESLDTNMLKKMRKGVTALQNVRLLKWAAELGIGVAWNILYGMPGEEDADIQSQAKLVPLIEHLSPPLFQCSKVRIDRFSPLYDALKQNDSSKVAPCLAYEIAFGIPRERVKDLAYYFDLVDGGGEDIELRVQPLRTAIDYWHKAVGRCAFVFIEQNSELYLFDNRRCADVTSAVLMNEQAKIFHAFDEGATVENVSRKLDVPMHIVRKAADYFVAKKWAVELESCILTLAVPVNFDGLGDLHEEIKGYAALALHAARMEHLSNVFGKRPEETDVDY
jgi:ribosomal peptide maturation radical SAM protein 1